MSPAHSDAHAASAIAGPSALPSIDDAWVPRLLIIDHDDSYTLNILVTLLRAIKCDSKNGDDADEARLASLLLSRTLIIRHTDPWLACPQRVRDEVLPHFDAIILSPGPGRPEVASDFGAASSMLRGFREASLAVDDDSNEPCLPTLGICLGHQGIASAFGGKIKRARHLRHGLSSKIEVVAAAMERCRWPSLLEEMEARQVTMTTYNSLVVDEASLPADLCVTAFANDTAPLSANVGSDEAERVIMALQHVELPLWGVQFHPESIESKDGVSLMRNFLRASKAYWDQQSQLGFSCASLAARRRLESWQHCDALPDWIQAHSSRRFGRKEAARPRSSDTVVTPWFEISMRKLGKLPASLATDVFERAFGNGDAADAVVWLDSARQSGNHSRFSYMARPAFTVSYDVNASTLELASGHRKTSSRLGPPLRKRKHRSSVSIQHGLATPSASRTASPVEEEALEGHNESHTRGFWAWLDAVQTSLRARTSERTAEQSAVPFCGGFVGYFGYEMKAESIPGKRSTETISADGDSELPSASLGFCDKVIVIDHELNECYAIGLTRRRNDSDREQLDALAVLETDLSKINVALAPSDDHFDKWCVDILQVLVSVKASGTLQTRSETARLPPLKPIDSQEAYIAKVEQARELIARGQSYELCLTTEFRGKMDEATVAKGTFVDHFNLYCHLRQRNPAPFSAYMRLDAKRSILSTSPEKFMSIDALSGLVEMKPIKGTAARAGSGKDAEEGALLVQARQGDESAMRTLAQLDRQRQDALKMDVKERAENLMIVDLIRRDVLGFCSPETVTVPKLMAIESYETVHQLVTTVHGRKPNHVGPVEALARCFPPGSMTGAPKVRSVQLLDNLEASRNEDADVDAPRRNGRGVYSGILGWIGVDGSASFNVLIRTVVADGRDVSVGAGGAITYLSSAEREWQEVLEKVGAIADVLQ